MWIEHSFYQLHVNLVLLISTRKVSHKRHSRVKVHVHHGQQKQEELNLKAVFHVSFCESTSTQLLHRHVEAKCQEKFPLWEAKKVHKKKHFEVKAEVSALKTPNATNGHEAKVVHRNFLHEIGVGAVYSSQLRIVYCICLSLSNLLHKTQVHRSKEEIFYLNAIHLGSWK